VHATAWLVGCWQSVMVVNCDEDYGLMIKSLWVELLVA